jgi:hypothetical protein
MTVTTACAGYAAPEDFYTAVYRPVINGDTNPGALHLYQPRHAIRMVDNCAGGQFQGSGAYSALTIGTRGQSLDYAGTYSNVVVKPAAITATTPSLTITGSIANFRDAAGCTITFRSSFELRAN